ADLPVDHGKKKKNTWKFKAVNVPDFTFAASKHHLWDASSLEVEPGRRVLISAVYPPESKFYSQAAAISRTSVDSLSSGCPGVPYPWPHMTVFNCMEGGGGMESPMMVNNGEQQTLALASEIIHHEIAHSYFPFITGANERRFAWLDEGWATHKGKRWSSAWPDSGKERFEGIYQAVSGTSLDLPLMVPSHTIAETSVSGYMSYQKAGMAMMTIEDQIGKKKMDLVWKTFVERWMWKHPQPWDFFATINEVAGENLNWLIKPWFYEFAFADIGIEKVDLESGSVSFRNVGGLPMPLYATLIYTDGSKKEIYRKANYWMDKDSLTIDVAYPEKLDKVVLEHDLLVDTDPTNNEWTR
ncbi:MAG: M1 family aminopeptidase, partial [Eudoraea sp.]|nr:M1 family aminopeptidase [Eudoraea sp.]